MRLTRRTAIWSGAALVGAVLVWLALRPSPVPVDVAAATIGPLQVTIDEEARTRVRDRYVVTAPIAGRVMRIALEAGDPVAGGAVVVRMTPLPLDPRSRAQAQALVAAAVDAQRAAAATVTQARETLAQARRERARVAELASRSLVAPAERERAELAESVAAQDLEAAEFRAQAAQHDVEAARAALIAAGAGAVVTLRAPVSGVVLRIPERSERVVQAGEPLLEVGNCGDLEIVADLLSSDAVKVRPGHLMLVEDWGGDSALVARVRRVEPGGFTKISALGVEEQRVHVVADLGQCPAALGDGYRVEARIVIWEADSVLKVPTTALYRAGEGWGVFVIDGGRAAERAVEVGRQNAFETEILSGLKPGELLVRHPGDRIRAGIRVRAR
jgi:HlyD family secretion protein